MIHIDTVPYSWYIVNYTVWFILTENDVSWYIVIYYDILWVTSTSWYIVLLLHFSATSASVCAAQGWHFKEPVGKDSSNEKFVFKFIIADGTFWVQWCISEFYCVVVIWCRSVSFERCCLQRNTQAGWETKRWPSAPLLRYHWNCFINGSNKGNLLECLGPKWCCWNETNQTHSSWESREGAFPLRKKAHNLYSIACN